MPESSPHEDATYEPDPLIIHCLREARFIIGVWACCFIYTVSYCYLHGYLVHEPLPSATPWAVTNLLGPLESFNRDPDSVTYPLGLGIPDWVFYGIILPWLLCIVASFWYGLFLFTEDDLGEGEAEGGEGTA